MKIPHDFEFDPTYGYTLEQLLAVRAPAAPTDFRAFWSETCRLALAPALNLEKRQVPCPKRGWKLYELEYDSWEGVRIGAWMLEPESGPVRRAMVHGHGYGGRQEPDYAWLLEETVTIFPCARGFDRSAHATIPGEADSHVRHGITSRESYVHRGCVVDYARAASVLLELFPQTCDRLFYHGGSFGGGIGALLLAMDRRFKRGYLNIPSFGNHPLRVTLPCVGSGESVRGYYREGHPEVLDVLAYYDAAVAAGFIEIPVFVAAATFDPAVPPPGQFAVYNMLPDPKALFLRQAAHFELEGNAHDDLCIRTRLRRWFAD